MNRTEKCGTGASLLGVRIPPSPPLNSPIRHFLNLQKASENNASGLPECASVEACIPQCRPQSSPPKKFARTVIEQPPADVSPTIEISSAPKFSELEDEYFELRKAGGASDSAISTGRMRAATFKALIGDRPIDCYLPID